MSLITLDIIAKPGLHQTIKPHSKAYTYARQISFKGARNPLL